MGVRIHLMACRDICCEETSLFKYLKFFSQNAEPLRPFPFRPKSGVYLIFYNICPYTPFKGISWGSFFVRKLARLYLKFFSHLMACRDNIYTPVRKLGNPFKYLKFFSQNAEPLRPLPFRPKSGVYLIFYNICPYTPFKGISGLGSISWHVETFVVRKLAHLNIWSFSAKMLNHSGPCHFGPKVVFIWFFTIFAPTPLSKANEGLQYVDLMACRDFYCEETSPFKYLKFFSQNAEPLRPLPFRPKSGVYLIFYNIYLPLHPFQRQMGVRIHLMACRDICCEETSLFKYLKFFSQNAEPLRPFPFRPKSGVYLIFYNICPYTPLVFIWFFTKAYEGSRSISWHVETFFVRKLAHLNIWSFSAKMLNHSALSISAQKWCLFDFLQYLPLHPFQRQMGVIHLMACRDICCEETNLFKYLKFFSQNAEPLRPF